MAESGEICINQVCGLDLTLGCQCRTENFLFFGEGGLNKQRFPVTTPQYLMFIMKRL